MFRRKKDARAKNAAPDSFIGLVMSCTSEMEIQSDWTKILQCSDAANDAANVDDLEEGVRQMRKRLKSKQHRVVMHALTLVESLVKNCNTNFALLRHIAGDQFLRKMAKLVERGMKKPNHDNLEAMEKCLDLFQSWSEAYHQHQDKGVQLFIAYYNEMRVKGAPFPRPLQHNTSVFSTGEVVRESFQSRSSQPGSPSEDVTPGGGLDHDDQVVSGTVDVILDTLSHMKSGDELIENAILPELLAQVHAAHSGIMERLQSALLMDPPPANIGSLLELNDKIHNSFRTYERIMEGGTGASSFAEEAAVSGDAKDGEGEAEESESESESEMKESGDGDAIDDIFSFLSDGASPVGKATNNPMPSPSSPAKQVSRVAKPASSATRRRRGSSGQLSLPGKREESEGKLRIFAQLFPLCSSIPNAISPPLFIFPRICPSARLPTFAFLYPKPLTTHVLTSVSGECGSRISLNLTII